ncbi:MAG: FAD-dependent thymidylate synthase [Faecalibacterium sp.]
MMTVRLIAHTPDPEKVVAAAAKLCYSDSHITDLLDGLDAEKTARFLTMLSDLGHASPTEHASFTFGIEGVSRSLLAQITRHRIASFSVQSQRYVRLDDFRYVVPPEIEAVPAAKAAFLASMEEDARRYLELAHTLEVEHTVRLMAEGLPEAQARAKAEKLANEDARFVLPNACETKMVVTMNARELNAFFRLRCCERAQWEIRALAQEMLRLVLPVAPHLFAEAGPACLTGPCPEGKMCCGKSAAVRLAYGRMKKGAAAHAEH